MKKIKARSTIFITIVLCLLLTSIFSLFYYQTSIHRTILTKSQKDLKNFNTQSIELFNYIIDDYFRQLEIITTLSVHISLEGQDHLIELVKKINQEKPYLNFAIISKDGILNDGFSSKDVHEKSYFTRAMAGEKVLAKVLKNEINDNEAILFALPIHNGDTIDGVAIARYETTAFMELIGNSQFQGKGATMIMAQDGSIICGYQGMENYTTLYEALKKFEFYDQEALNTMQETVNKGDSGFLSYFENKKDRYLYYQPIGKEGWYMISLVMASGLYNQYQEIANISYAILFGNVILYGIMLVFIYLTYRELRKVFRENQRDPLTRTYNKVSAKALSESYLKESEQTDCHACFFLDIDDFKAVNDTYGHKCGDEMILYCTDVLTSNFRRSDVISRFGGDEFFILMRDVKDEDYIRLKAQNLLDHFARNTYHATISIGISLYPKHGTSYEELLSHADVALYDAKSKGKRSYSIYETDMEQLKQTEEDENKRTAKK